jgi:hypothetical protein
VKKLSCRLDSEDLSRSHHRGKLIHSMVGAPSLLIYWLLPSETISFREEFERHLSVLSAPRRDWSKAL